MVFGLITLYFCCNFLKTELWVEGWDWICIGRAAERTIRGFWNYLVTGFLGNKHILRINSFQSETSMFLIGPYTPSLILIEPQHHLGSIDLETRFKNPFNIFKLRNSLFQIVINGTCSYSNSIFYLGQFKCSVNYYFWQNQKFPKLSNSKPPSWNKSFLWLIRISSSF